MIFNLEFVLSSVSGTLISEKNKEQVPRNENLLKISVEKLQEILEKIKVLRLILAVNMVT